MSFLNLEGGDEVETPTVEKDQDAAEETAGLRASRLAIHAPAHIHELLDRLHELSSAQEATMNFSTNIDRSSEEARLALDYVMRDKFIALDQDKCHFVYNVIRSTGATNIIEAGTSYGVSTIYLALAVGQNLKDGNGKASSAGKVIATEHEPEKAKAALEYWEECGEEVTAYIDLREGDLLETLKMDLPEVDLLLLDIWTPLALPTLKLVMPKLKKGALIIADNTVSSAESYTDLLSVLRAPNGPFRSITLPFSGGLEMSTYLP